MPRLFGTDGIRGVANVDLRPTTAYALGRAVAHRLAGPGGAIVVGQDTRRSGDMFVAAIVAGATSLGVDVHIVGVVPTPALAFIAGSGPVRGRDHGLRLAQPGPGQRAQGPRRARAQARRRGRGRAGAAHLADRAAGRRPQRRPRPDGRRVDAAGRLPGPPARSRGVRSTPAGSRLVLDAANGSASVVGPRILAATGAQVDVIHAEPDGSNINVRSGATSPASLAAGGHRDRRGRGLRARRRRGPADRGRRGRAGRRRRPGPRASWPSTGWAATPCPAAGSSCRSSRTAGSRRSSRRPAARSSGRRSATSTSSRGCRSSGAVLGGEKSGHVIVLEHTTSGRRDRHRAGGPPGDGRSSAWTWPASPRPSRCCRSNSAR